MDKVKQILLLVAGIVLIVTGVVTFIGVIVDLNTVISFIIDHGWFDFVVTDLALCNLLLFFSIPLIIMGGLLCGKNRKNKSIVITSVVFSSIILLFVIIYIAEKPYGINYSFYQYIVLVFVIAVLGLLITSLCLKGSLAETVAPVKKSGSFSDKDKKIELLDKMKNEGKITEAEYKKLLLKELEK